jgi:hypothetical protein
MPDKIRYGNDYRIAIGIEYSYNAGGTEAPVGEAPSATSWANLVVLPGTLEITQNNNKKDTKFKPQSAVPHPYSELVTTKSCTATYTGEFGLYSKILLDLWFNQKNPANGIYKMQANPNKTPLSAVIYMIHNDSSETPYKVDKAQGCKLQSLVIEGSQSSGFIGVTATFEGTIYQRELSQAITGTDPGMELPEPALFGDIIDNLAFGAINYGLESFGLTLNNVFTSDSTKYANSRYPAYPLIIGYDGELKYTVLFDANGNEADLDYLDNSEREKTNNITIVLRPGVEQKELLIETVSIATALDKPDPGNDIFKLNYTGKLASLAKDPIIITASNWIET